MTKLAELLEEAIKLAKEEKNIAMLEVLVEMRNELKKETK